MRDWFTAHSQQRLATLMFSEFFQMFAEYCSYGDLA